MEKSYIVAIRGFQSDYENKMLQKEKRNKLDNLFSLFFAIKEQV